jgi:cbb3-type cytochrome oxidase subunit 3
VTDWVALYKFGRLAVLALLLVGIGVWLYTGKRRERLELPAQRMLEDDET